MVYEMSASRIKKLEMKLNKMIRKWLGVSKSLTDVALYCQEVPCPLPFKSLGSLFKTTKTNMLLQLKDSKDPQVRDNAAELSRKKCEITKTVDRAESRIFINKITEELQLGRAGFGLIPRKQTPQKGSKAYRRLAVDMVRKEEDARLFVKAVQQGVQGRWTMWKDYTIRDLRWRSLLGTAPSLVRFCIGVTYDTLGSTSNLYRWGISTDPFCALYATKKTAMQLIFCLAVVLP